MFIFDITANEVTISNFVSLVSFAFGLCGHRFQSENAFFDLGAPNCRALDSVPHDDGYITTLSFNSDFLESYKICVLCFGNNLWFGFFQACHESLGQNSG